MTRATHMHRLPDHLSVSSSQLYRRCPAQWKRRYLDGIIDLSSPAMAFGKAFAIALEAHHRGDDGDVAFARAHAASGNAVPGRDLTKQHNNRSTSSKPAVTGRETADQAEGAPAGK